MTFQSVPLSSVVDVNPRGWSIAPEPDEPVSFVPMAAVEAVSGKLDPSHHRPWREVQNGYTKFEEGDVLFAKITPSMENGKAALAVGLIGGRGVGSTEFHVLRASGDIHPRFLLHFVLQERFRRAARAQMRGVAGQLRVPPEFFKDIEITLPSLDEQKRIVDEIETQFARLDDAVAALQRARTRLKRYRASVLKAACEGRLVPTEAVWPIQTLGQHIERIEAGKNMRCEERPPTPDEVGIIKISAVTWGTFNELESKTCYDPSVLRDDLLVQPGDFLISRANTIELVGACVIVHAVNLPVMLSDKVLRITFGPDLDPRWTMHFLRSTTGRQEIESRASGSQNSMRNIGQGRIKDISIPVPPLDVQHRVVEEIERRMSVIEQMETTTETSLKRAEVMRQAILRQAFQGRWM